MAKILVVDDDRLTRELIEALLVSKGFEVTTAHDGMAAVAEVSRQSFDLILVDVWMPRMPGLKLLAGLRAMGRMPRAIVMTSDETPEVVIKAVRAQAQRFIRKPIDPQVLLEQVNKVLALPDLPPIEVISATPSWVELDVPCTEAAADRIHDFLSKLDADLSEDLRESVSQAFRELLMNAIEWGGQFDPQQVVRISHLRTKRLLLYRISDPGAGFRFEGLEHAAVSNPESDPVHHTEVRQEMGLRAGGFGILMAREFVDEILYNEAQNEVVLLKYLDESG
ncbi:MAG: response regulator [Candidatus Eisenbacteria bacterium]|nr:response regulator [Candidatus Eisenbacteria bacterium]